MAGCLFAIVGAVILYKTWRVLEVKRVGRNRKELVMLGGGKAAYLCRQMVASTGWRLCCFPAGAAAVAGAATTAAFIGFEAAMEVLLYVAALRFALTSAALHAQPALQSIRYTLDAATSVLAFDDSDASLLGTGSSASVYRGKLNGQPVAVKVSLSRNAPRCLAGGASVASARRAERVAMRRR